MHSRTEKAVKYDGPLESLTAEILLVWARLNAIEIERVGFKDFIENLRDQVDTEPRDLERWESIYQGGEEDLKFLKEKYVQLTKEAEQTSRKKQELLDELLEDL